MSGATATADLLRRAAELLDMLDRTATSAPWRAIVTGTESCDGIATVCESPDHPADVPNWVYDCCPSYGAGPALVKAADATLIVALRPIAAPLAAWLRHQATYAEVSGSEYLTGHGAHARAVASAVLGISTPGSSR